MAWKKRGRKMLRRKAPLNRRAKMLREGKYHVLPATQRMYNGALYDSRTEAKMASELDLRVKAGLILSWRRQVSVRLEVGGELICRYVIDFEVEHLDASLELVEMKGFETDTWRLKHKLFLATWAKEHPAVKYTVLRVNSPNAVLVETLRARAAHKI